MNLLLNPKKKKTISLYSSVLAAPLVLAPSMVMLLSGQATVLADDGSTNANHTGHLDVYVDHTKLDEALNKATAEGLSITREDAPILTGDATETEKNIETAKKYYVEKEKEILSKTAKYKADKAQYDAAVSTNKADADSANALMSALLGRATVNGQATLSETKVYNADVVAKDKAAIEAKLQKGVDFNNTKDAIAQFAQTQAGMTVFETQANQGNFKLVRKTVQVSSVAEVAQYETKIKEAQARATDWVNKHQGSSGTIIDKPTFELYDLVVSDTLKAEASAPITISHYTPVVVSKPSVSSVTYHYYDIRQQSKTSREGQNADKEKIVELVKESNNGQKVVQAMVNQTVGVSVADEALPANRFDKYHNYERTFYLPENVEYDPATSKLDPEKWEVSYDKENRIVRVKATASYLAEINKRQHSNNGGTVGGTVDNPFAVDSSAIFFKLLKDDTTYQVRTHTVINDEYRVDGTPITIRTSSSKPQKHNYLPNTTTIIDGKAVLPGSVNTYGILIDNSPYKGVNIDKKMQEKLLQVLDVYPNDALSIKGKARFVDQATGKVLYEADVDESKAISGVFKDVNGKEAKGVTYRIVDIKDLPQELQEKLKGRTGKVLIAEISGHDHPYYKNYVEQGKNVLFTVDMLTKKIDNTPNEKGGSYNGNTYKNLAFTSFFGNAYQSNDVTNTVPKIDPKKDAVISLSNVQSYDLKKNPQSTIEQGSNFMYEFKHSELPTNLAQAPTSIGGRDKIAADDEFNGRLLSLTHNKIEFKKGTAFAERYPNGLAAGSDLTKYLTWTITRDQASKISELNYTFDRDFINAIDFSKNPFSVSVWAEMKRLTTKNGVTNTFTEVISTTDFDSNEVVTNSSENQMDKLKKQLDNLSKRFDTHEKEDQAFRKSTLSSLSVIVKTFEDAAKKQAETDANQNKAIANNAAAIASLTVKYLDTDKAIKNLTPRVEKVEKEVESNKAAIQTLNQKTGVLEEKTKDVTDDTKWATLTIEDLSVNSTSKALEYAVQHGIAGNSIQKVEKNRKGQYVVFYDKDAKTSPLTRKKVTTITYYTLKSEAEVREAVKKAGFNPSLITSIVEKNGAYEVKIVEDVADEQAKAESPKATTVANTSSNGTEDPNAKALRLKKFFMSL